jgi:hypothetical protein
MIRHITRIISNLQHIFPSFNLRSADFDAFLRRRLGYTGELAAAVGGHSASEFGGGPTEAPNRRHSMTAEQPSSFVTDNYKYSRFSDVCMQYIHSTEE